MVRGGTSLTIWYVVSIHTGAASSYRQARGRSSVPYRTVPYRTVPYHTMRRILLDYDHTQDMITNVYRCWSSFPDLFVSSKYVGSCSYSTFLRIILDYSKSRTVLYAL
jgi:hypothetical protein